MKHQYLEYGFEEVIIRLLRHCQQGNTLGPLDTSSLARKNVQGIGNINGGELDSHCHLNGLGKLTQTTLMEENRTATATSMVLEEGEIAPNLKLPSRKRSPASPCRYLENISRKILCCLQGEMDRRMSAVENKIERIDNSLLACQAGLSQPLTQEILSFADAVGHPQNSHPSQQTPTSTRSTTTSKKRLPPSTSQHVDPAKTLVVAKPSDPIWLQNTMNLQTNLNERDRSIVPLIATAK
ncbi:hypothetical protein CAPTEDRAFT_198281, partial [Capitella teleta]